MIDFYAQYMLHNPYDRIHMAKDRQQNKRYYDDDPFHEEPYFGVFHPSHNLIQQKGYNDNLHYILPPDVKTAQ